MPVRSQAAVEAVYDDLRPLIQGTARNFARKYNRRKEDCVAEAALAFLQAYRSWVPGQGPLKGRVTFRIWNQLLEETRLEAQRLARLPRDPRRSVLHRPTCDDPVFDPDTLARFGEGDPKVVLDLLLDSPPELETRIQATETPGPEAIRRTLKEYLVEVLEWTESRVGRAFAHIRALI